MENIAGRLPENSRNSFVDPHAQKTVKNRPKKFASSLKADMLYFDLKNLYKCFVPLLAVL